MPRTIELSLSPAEAADVDVYVSKAARGLGVSVSDVAHCRILRRSVDARKRGDIRVNMLLELCVEASGFVGGDIHLEWGDVSCGTEVVVVGSGPAGLFLALELIELGFRPLVLERGRSVSARKVDVAALNRGGLVNSDSNYAFGAGGAGTFSDGKLYTRSKKRGSNAKVLEILRYHGADESILYDAHPHIGTDKLPGVIRAIGETIQRSGGRVLYDTRVVELIIKEGRVEGVVTGNGDRISASVVALARVIRLAMFIRCSMMVVFCWRLSPLLWVSGWSISSR